MQISSISVLRLFKNFLLAHSLPLPESPPRFLLLLDLFRQFRMQVKRSLRQGVYVVWKTFLVDTTLGNKVVKTEIHSAILPFFGRDYPIIGFGIGVVFVIAEQYYIAMANGEDCAGKNKAAGSWRAGQRRGGKEQSRSSNCIKMLLPQTKLKLPQKLPQNRMVKAG